MDFELAIYQEFLNMNLFLNHDILSCSPLNPTLLRMKEKEK